MPGSKTLDAARDGGSHCAVSCGSDWQGQANWSQDYWRGGLGDPGDPGYPGPQQQQWTPDNQGQFRR
jgi:hypothetical protein